MRQYFQDLELQPGADQDAITSAYRRLAKQYHPDRNPGDKEAEAKFLKVQEAYDVLSGKKQAQPSNENPFGAGGFPFSGFSGFGGFSVGIDPNNPHNKNGSDIVVNVQVSLKEAVLGTVKTINIKRKKVCLGCAGEGFTESEKCKMCDGKGMKIQSTGGPFSFQVLCPGCIGSGKIPKNKCPKCSGKRTDGEEQKEFSVNIPKGINDNSTLVLHGEGEQVFQKGNNGNLVIRVSVTKDNVFRRENNDLVNDIYVPFSTMVLGGEVVVKDIEDATYRININPETKADTVLRIKEKGYPSINNPSICGDLLTYLKTDIPKNLSEDALKAVENLKQYGL